MLILKKNRENLRSVMVTYAVISMVFSGIACDKSTPGRGVTADSSTDAKLSADRIKEAEALYDGREDLMKARVAVAALRQARTADYGNYEAAWKLSRASFYVGENTDNEDERDDMFREGTEAGKVAIELQPNKPEGHFWLGANYGGAAAHSTIANLSSFQDIRGEMETVLRLDESYQGYSVYLGLGRLYLQAPRVLGGDSAKAIDYLEKGLKLSPNNSLMRYHLAEAYEANNRDAEAKKQLEELLASTPDPEHIAEHKGALVKAKKLLEKIKSNSRR